MEYEKQRRTDAYREHMKREMDHGKQLQEQARARRAESDTTYTLTKEPTGWVIQTRAGFPGRRYERTLPDGKTLTLRLKERLDRFGRWSTEIA